MSQDRPMDLVIDCRRLAFVVSKLLHRDVYQNLALITSTARSVNLDGTFHFTFSRFASQKGIFNVIKHKSESFLFSLCQKPFAFAIVGCKQQKNLLNQSGGWVV